MRWLARTFGVPGYVLAVAIAIAAANPFVRWWHRLFGLRGGWQA